MNDSKRAMQSDVKDALSETQKSLDRSLQNNRQLIDKLKNTRRDYRTIFDSVPAMIWYRDRSGRILKVNRCAADSVGMTVSQLVGQDYYQLFPDDAARARRQDLEVMETGRPLLGQLRAFMAFNRLKRWAMVDRIPLRGQDGSITGVMVFAIDITDKKTAEDELLKTQNQLKQTVQRLKATVQQARLLAEKATRSNQAKSRLLASSGHDLRTPMNSIIGFAEILMTTPLDEEQTEYVKTLHQAAGGLLCLIDDILDYSRIETGKLKIDIVACPVRETVNDVRKMMQTEARKKGLDFIVEIDKTIPQTFFTDPTRLKQCLINLVGNAVKFTAKGHVAIFVQRVRHADQPCIRFDVQDTGIGIPADKQDVIFNAFSQADDSISPKYGGSGLGLAITRQLAGLLGGEISLISEVDTGTTFSLTLPLFVPKPMENSPTHLAMRQNRRSEDIELFKGRILLAEKAFPSQLTLSLILCRFGLDVCLAGSLEQVRESLRQHEFDLIFLDEAMGYENVVKLVQSMHGQMPPKPVILVSEQDGQRDNRWRQAGFAECITRPLSREQLYAVIGRQLPENTGVSTASDFSEQSDDSIASVESLLEKLPELAGAAREVLAQSDMELLSRFAELFAEIGQATEQNCLTEIASGILDLISRENVPIQTLSGLVEQVCMQCEQIYADRDRNPNESQNRQQGV